MTLGLCPAGVACLYCICGIWWKCPRYKPDPSNITEEGLAKIVWVMQGVLERSAWSGPPKMPVVLLSVSALPEQSLLHLHPTHTTHLPSTFPRPQLVIILIKRVMRRGPPYWFPW